MKHPLPPVKDKILQLIIRLTNELNHHNQLYYKDNAPVISDREFDDKLLLLKKYEDKYPHWQQKDSPTLKVGHLSQAEKTLPHPVPMLSLNNAFNKQDLINFNQRVSKITQQIDNPYVCELKIDGLSVALIYQNYVLQAALTRGDGQKGQNITAHIKTIKNIPRRITEANAVIHGEVYLDKKAFAKLNQHQQKHAVPLFINPRNAAAGTLSIKNDLATVQQRQLTGFWYFWYLQPHFTPPLAITSTQAETLIKLQKNNFAVAPDWKMCNNIQQVWTYIQTIVQKKTTYNFAIDGIVIKVNDQKWWPYLGATSKASRWAIAYKFSAKSKTTTLLKIEAQVGRTGKITYVGWFQPIMLVGTYVQKASLSNYQNIKKMQLNVNDQIEVTKAGEIIPQIINNKSRNHKSKQIFPIIDHCPACHSRLITPSNYVDQFCVNNRCWKKQILKIDYLASKTCLNIKGISVHILEQLFTAKIVTSIQDFILLKNKREALLTLDHWQEKKVNNILAEITKAKQASPAKVLTALGIPHIGFQTATILLHHLKSFHHLQKATAPELNNIYTMSATKTQAVRHFFQKSHNKALIAFLQKNGFKTKMREQQQPKQWHPFFQKRFVITGKLKQTRVFYVNLITTHGGLNQAMVNSKTDYLICNQQQSSSKKFQTAQKFHVKIINESKFKKMLEN